MKTAFLFLDECIEERLNLAALTGVLVPTEQYSEVRSEIAFIALRATNPRPGTIPQPLELHGSSLLAALKGTRSESDLHAAQLSVLDAVVQLINTHRLRVRRIAYTNKREIGNLIELDKKLYGLNFLGMAFWLGPIMTDTLVVPVMDGIPDTSKNAHPAVDGQLIRSFSATVRMAHQLVAAGHENMVSIMNSHNLGEPLYGDSSHATLLQLADLTSYLLLQIDKEEVGGIKPGNLLHEAALALAKQLDPTLVEREALEMKFT